MGHTHGITSASSPAPADNSRKGKSPSERRFSTSVWGTAALGAGAGLIATAAAVVFSSAVIGSDGALAATDSLAVEASPLRTASVTAGNVCRPIVQVLSEH